VKTQLISVKTLLISALYPFGFLHWTFVLFFYFCRLLSRPRGRGFRAPPAQWTIKLKLKIGPSPKIFENRLCLGCFLLADFAQLLGYFGQSIAQETTKFGDLGITSFRFGFISSKFSSSLHVLAC
jgi:hypothetical protein